METRLIKFTTLTPIFTGGVDQDMERIHETGIIGSLRWWYEALVRGVGGYACDPSNSSCLYSVEDDSGICEACRLFGATGWRRRFRLTLSGAAQAESTAEWRTRRRDAWQFSVPRCDAGGDTSVYLRPGFTGPITLRFAGKGCDLDLLVDLLLLVTRVGSLGARCQVGFGIVTIEEHLAPTGELAKRLKKIAHAHAVPVDPAGRPSAADMFLARVALSEARHKVEGEGGIETMVQLKADLRSVFRPSPDTLRTVRHALLGTVEGERISSKVNVSRPYQVPGDGGNWTMRVWGWVPASMSAEPIAGGGATSLEVFNRIEMCLKTFKSYPGLCNWLDLLANMGTQGLATKDPKLLPAASIDWVRLKDRDGVLAQLVKWLPVPQRETAQ